MIKSKILGSFRDPSGFIFSQNGILYRQINNIYKENYRHLIDSGLYKHLVDSGLLISHQEVDSSYGKSSDAYKIIKPESIPFISYPYEWCFSQLKDAALLTLQVQKRALDFGMSLKDCSAYNIQFIGSRPVFIDTISFEKYRKGEPWVAYKQFCQHFFAALALMCYRDIRLSQLLRIYIDGLPLDLTSKLLPLKTFFKLSLISHIHFHAQAQKFFQNKPLKKERFKGKMSLLSLRGLIDSLESSVKSLKWRPKETEWSDYYRNLVSYNQEAFTHKKQIISNFLDKFRPRTVWDLGANIGVFSRMASDRAIQTISFDSDPVCVEINYLNAVKQKETNILPLLIDLTNPSAGMGWENQERASLLSRGPTQTLFALGLIHHLAISNNLPLDKIADFFAQICHSLIIEFIPKNDVMVQKLLSTRDDVFVNYTKEAFEKEFNRLFSIEECVNINNSKRNLYLMVRR